MTYVIVTGQRTVIGEPFPSFSAAFETAVGQFGKDVRRWLELNLRVEENR
jgi:hypothetical protein